MEVDRAVSYGVMASVTSLVAAPITMLLIARYLTPEMQGFYYTFGSLIALQTYMELGLAAVVLNTASHEWAHLGLDADGKIVGDPEALSRLVSLGRFIFKWYAVASTLFMACVGVAGYAFFSRERAEGVAWVGPWWLLVVLSGLVLWALPFHALLEGCNQVTTVQRFRLSQIVLRYIALWMTLALGGHLWAAVAAVSATVLRDVYLLAVQYRRFFGPFLSKPNGAVIRWRAEILPMQWRMAIGGIVSYLLFNAFNPVMFHYHGAVVAGQMGMTMSAVFALQGLTWNWLTPKVPRFGMLVARREYAELDRLWLRTTRASLLVASVAAGSAWLIILALNVLNIHLSERLVSPLPVALLLMATVLMAVGYCETAYLRAHKQEPIMVLSVVTSVLMGLLVWTLGARFGPVGAAAAYLLVIGGISLPWQTLIWVRKRTEWHAADALAL